MPLLHLDYETFSELPLTGKLSVGTHRYVHHESTEVLLAAYAVDDGDVVVEEFFNPRMDIRWRNTPLHRMLLDESYTIVAYNAQFERLVTQYVVGLPLPASRYLCTMALAWSMSFTGRLDEVGHQMGLPQDKQKLARSKRMMQKFCSPRRPSKHNPATRWTPDMDPEGWDEFREYCAQDVEASRAVMHRCAPWPAIEHETWCLDQDINDTGWPLDTLLVRNANLLRAEEDERLREELKRLTGLDNPNSHAQFSRWLSEQGLELPNLQAETVDASLADMEFAGYVGPVRDALTLRRQLSAATPKKWAALERTMHEGRAKATLAFGAASRTQRWGGRVIQPQNLYSEREHDTDEVADLLTHCDRATLEALYGDVQRVLKAGIRPAITAPEGYSLVVCDLSSIESRLLGWHAEVIPDHYIKRISTLFANGHDTYKDLASRIFGVPVSEVTKAQRTFAKPPELGCGYLLGGPGLRRYAADMGVDMELDTAKDVVRIWRAANPAVLDMWDWLRDAAFNCVRDGTEASGHGVTFRKIEGYLTCQLPSGRCIYYFDPVLSETDHNGEPAYGGWNLTYMGRYQDEGGRWQRVHTHPGKITENIIQAVARDILRDALLSARLNKALTIVGHVHDEIVALVRTDVAESALAFLRDVMATTPAWAPGLLLDAEGFITRRYKKG